jgi:hypothetical protein
MTVIGLGAWCDYVTEDEYRTKLGRSTLRPEHAAEELEHFRDSVSFKVSEFADLADGRRVWLHREERGFRTAARTYFSGADGTSGETRPARVERTETWPTLALEGIEHSVRNTVLPDDDDTEDEHPWEWLAGLARAQGVDVTPDELRAVPYAVEFSDRLRERVPRQAGGE